MIINKYKGFTLIELLIVIAILGILSTIGLNNFMSARIKARDLSKKADLQSVAKSLEAYANDHRSYPLTGALSWGNAFIDPAVPTTIYVAKLPGNTTSPEYFYISDGTTYTLYTNLENREDTNILATPETCATNKTCNYKIKSSNQ